MGHRPIGVFDSGVGGLSVLRHIRALLPHDDLLYVADSAHAPYGPKSNEFIEARTLAVADFFQRQDVKAIVVACNTATAAAVATLRATCDLPIVGLEPGIKPAAQMTRSGVVGVLATQNTLASARFAALVDRHAQTVRVVTQACHGLVERIEQGDWQGEETRSLVEHYVAPLREQGADTVVLGCTHYPFIADLVRKAAGPGVDLVDTGMPVARRLADVLQRSNRAASGEKLGSERFLTSGDPRQVGAVINRLWDRPAQVETLPA